MLYEMGMKEKEREVYFLEQIRKSRLPPLFERLFSWGAGSNANDVDVEKKFLVRESDEYCKTYKARNGAGAGANAGPG